MPLNSLKYLFCTVLLLGFGTATKCQQPIQFDHLGIEKGLSQTSVLSICQDSKGFMWFGTRYGLNRYDGYNIKVYQPSNTDSLSISNNYITSLFSDSHKNLWIGTNAGLNKYNEKTDNFEHFYTKPEGISHSEIRCITEDKNGNIWIGTLDGLNLLINGNPAQIKTFFTIKSKDAKYHNIRVVKEDHAGNIWIGTSNGLLKMTFKDGKYQTLLFSNRGKPGDISENYITGIIEDNQHQLWISTQDNGLNLFIPSSQTFKNFKHSDQKNSIVNNVIRTMVLDDAGKLWIGTLDGISVMDTQNFSFTNLQYDPDHKKSLSQNSVHRLYKDQNGSIWVGTYFGGININYPYTTAFNIYSTSKSNPSINNNVVSSFAEDENKNLWIGTEGGGLNYFNRLTQNFTAFKNNGQSNSIKSNLIKKIILDKTGKLWIGTHAGGLNVYDSKNRTFKNFNFSKQQEEVPDEITAVVEDLNGRLYVASQRNGVKVSDPEKNKFYNFYLPSNFSKNAKVKALTVSKNLVYFGTTNGICIYNINKKRFYTLIGAESKKPLDYYVNSITVAKNEEIYICTYNKGLVRYHPKTNKLINYTVKNGLPNDNVLGVLEDDKGNLWVSTANGLSMFNKDNRTFKNYTVADGLASNEFNANAIFKSSRGEMFFGGYSGIISFYPNRIQTNNKAATLVITDLKVDNKSVKINGNDKLLDQNIGLKDKLVFANNQNTFSLSFALLNFIKPEKNHYAYKMDGFEKNWNYVNIPIAAYTNLPTGNYTFLVKGINNDGVPSSSIRKIKITINPPFYRTWWAYLFYFGVFIAISIVFIRYLLIKAVLKKEKEINEHKLEFFTNISHEIRTPLTLIVGPLEKLIEGTKDNPSLNRDLQPIKNNADRLMNLITELLDFRKAESGKMTLNISPNNIIKFCHEIFLVFQNLAISKNINYDFETEIKDFELYFDKVQMEKVLFNLLSNAFKFTPKNGNVQLKIKVEDQLVKIEVHDNGEGIPLEEQANLFTNFYQANSSTNIGTGLGLSFSKSIVELHHGQITFKSTPKMEQEHGATCFIVSLKTGKTHFNQTDLTDDYIHDDDIASYEPFVHSIPPSVVEEDSVPILNDSKKYNLLVVEDNKDVREFIKNAFSGSYNIYEQENGAKGLECALELIPDLIISDVMMPIMDGLEMCRKLKTDERTSHIPIVLLTARSAYVHQINGLENGADAYIMKPFSLKILELSIKNLLSARENIKQKFAQVITLEPTNVVINSTEQHFLNKIIGFIEDSIADPDFDVPTLSSQIGMSQPVLYKKIRALTDLSVNDFIKSIRLKRAAQLLKQGAGNITEIAYAVGFNDRKYFSIEFKKYFGKTPSEYAEAKI